MEWRAIERFTMLHLIQSQVDALTFKTTTAKVLIRKDLLKSLIDHAQQEIASISFIFTPLGKAINTAEDANKILLNEK
jgi:hypothetical protein